jgi:hypothetical protein
MGIVYDTSAWKIGDIKKSKVMNGAYEMGKIDASLFILIFNAFSHEPSLK